MLVRSGTQVTADVIKAGKKLKVIGRAGVGVDNIDVDKATEGGILVINAPEGNTISAAEHTMALMLALARNVSRASASVRENLWQRGKFLVLNYTRKILNYRPWQDRQRSSQRARLWYAYLWPMTPYISTEQVENSDHLCNLWKKFMSRIYYIARS